jgi:hypothetical protein
MYGHLGDSEYNAYRASGKADISDVGLDCGVTLVRQFTSIISAMALWTLLLSFNRRCSMAMLVTMGAQLQCSFGVAPSVLSVTPENRVMDHNMPVATIMDHIPGKNILPFGMCNAPSNPAFIAATAAKLGIPTPVPCTPVTITPWVPGSFKVMIANKPALNDTSKLMCMWAGVISILPGPPKANVP